MYPFQNFNHRMVKGSFRFPAGFATYITENIDTISKATPMLIFRETGGEMVSSIKLLIGNVSGSLGETSALFIILAGIYLIYIKVAAWQTMAGVLVGFTGLSSLLYLLGNSQIPNPIFGILSGGFFYLEWYLWLQILFLRQRPRKENGYTEYL